MCKLLSDEATLVKCLRYLSRSVRREVFSRHSRQESEYGNVLVRPVSRAAFLDQSGLGLGYPVADVPLLSWMDRYIRPHNLDRLPFNFDFLGVQNYIREVVRHTPYIPLLWELLVEAHRHKVPFAEMG